MTKVSNYLVTVTDVKESLLVSYGQTAPANSDRITISENSGGFEIGTVGVTPTFCLDDLSPILTNPDGKCPVYQDLVKRPVFSGIVNSFFISATGGFGAPTINCTTAEFSYLISIGAITGSTTGTTTFTATVSTNVTLKGTSIRWIYYGNNPAVLGVDYNVVAYAGNPAPYASNYVQIELLKSIIPGTPYNFAFNAQYNAPYNGTYSLSQAISGTDGCNGPFTNSQPNAQACTYVTTTSTTTCNPTPNWQNTGFNCYGTCNKYNVQTDQNPCSPTYNTTRQGSLVETNTTYCGGCCGQSTAPSWANQGVPYCDNCVSKQLQRDTNVCSPTYNQTQVINSGSACNTSQNWVNTGNYDCYGTCSKYNVEIQANPCAPAYNTTRPGSVVEFNSTFCGGCCGQSTTANWVNSGNYNCYGSCDKYNVEVDNNGCSPTYNQTRQGSLVETNTSFCGGCCGASSSANWVNNGAADCFGTCNLYQPQIDANPCSPTYGDTRNADLGPNTGCGSWYTIYYCANYGVAPYEQRSRELNTCVPGTYRNDQFVTNDSPSCGYVPPPACRQYQIIGYNSDESVNGVYTNCSGFPDSFSFFGGPGTVGYVCAQASSVYVTSGNGAATDVGGC
jgi:hypothetical protein